MLKYKIMFQIFFVPKYFWVLEALIFGTLLPDHPVYTDLYKPSQALLQPASILVAIAVDAILRRWQL